MVASTDTDIISAIGDPVRRALLEHLRDGPRSSAILASQLGLTKPVVASHLKVLRKAGWIRSQGEGVAQLHAMVPETQERLLRWVSRLQPPCEAMVLPIDAVEARARMHETEWPSGDADTYRIGHRLLRMSTHVERSLRETAGSVNLLGAELLLLDALRLAGPPYAASPSQLQKSLAMTGGGITKCVDRLVEMGLVQRRADPSDGRGVVVSMTKRAHTLADELVEQGPRGIDAKAAGRMPRERRALLGQLLHELVVLADAELESRRNVQTPRVHQHRNGRPAVQSAAGGTPSHRKGRAARS